MPQTLRIIDMDINPYQAPEANVEMQTTEKEYEFYVVSGNKFLILYIGTLGLYTLYWFYQNWSLFRHSHKLNLWPIPRAIFSVFFTHALFKHVNKALDNRWKYMGTATLFVIFTIASTIASTILDMQGHVVASSLVSIVILFLSAWVLYGAQIKINEACGSQNGSENSQLTGMNVIFLIIGAILWLLMLLGTFWSL